MNLMEFDFTQLNYFRAVAKLEHMTRAAESLHISQPALSAAISRLEQKIGHPLFLRSPNSIRLNASGQIFLRYVERIFAEMNAGLTELGNLNGEEFGQIRFATYSPGMGLDIVNDYLLTHRNISMFHEILSPFEMLSQLENGSLDFAISMEEIRSEHVEWTPLYRDHLDILMSPLHPLSQRRELHVEELAHERFALMTPDGHTCAKFRNLCKKAGFTPDVFYSGNDISLITFLAVNNLCLLVCPAASQYYARRDPLAASPKGTIVPVPLASSDGEITVGIAKRKNGEMSLAAQSFCRRLLQGIAPQTEIALCRSDIPGSVSLQEAPVGTAPGG